MIAPDLLEILRCPQTRQSLTPATPELLARLNRQIASPAGPPLRNRGGGEVREPLVAGLVCTDQSLLYPIREEIPILLVEEGIPL